jgi:hypothetical protein
MGRTEVGVVVSSTPPQLGRRKRARNRRRNLILFIKSLVLASDHISAGGHKGFSYKKKQDMLKRISCQIGLL